MTVEAQPAPKDDALTTARAALADAILETDATEPFGDALDDGIPTDHGRQVWAHRLALELAANPQRAQDIVGRYFAHTGLDFIQHGLIAAAALTIVARDVLGPLIDGDTTLAADLTRTAAAAWRTPTREETP